MQPFSEHVLPECGLPGLQASDDGFSTDDLFQDCFPALRSAYVPAASSNGHESSEASSPVALRRVTQALEQTEDIAHTNLYSKNYEEAGSNQKQSAASESDLIRKIHRQVNIPENLGISKDPASVRRSALEALAREQNLNTDATRIRRGQLSAAERRIVRTVSNRGAAIRSRMRQRQSMVLMREQIRSRNTRISQLESVVRALCSAYAVPLPSGINIGMSAESVSLPNLEQGKNNLL